MRTSASFISAFNCLSTNCSGDCSSKNLPLPVPLRLGLLRLSPDELRVRVSGRGRLFGWVTEWLIVHAWKACVPKGTGGSNPPPSVLLRACASQDRRLVCAKQDALRSLSEGGPPLVLRFSY